MDCERNEIHETIKELLQSVQFNIIDFYIQKHTYTINNIIDTNTISVDLAIIVYSQNENNLFDKISIYTNNDTLFKV